MRENSYNIAAALRAGLVPHSGFPPGADYATTMRNLRPRGWAATSPEWFTAPFDFTLDWPHPQVYRGENITLLLHSDGVSTLDSDWNEAALTLYESDSRDDEATLAGEGVWHVASFEDVWFAVNGTDFAFQIPAYDKALVAQGITCKTLCRHGDRLILAGLDGDWFDGDRFQRLFTRWRQTQPGFAHDRESWSARWVIWMDRGARDVAFWWPLVALGVFGNEQFDLLEPEILKRLEAGQFGFTSVRSLGAPLRALPLGEHVALYSAEARVFLVPGEPYRAEVVGHAGCASRSAIAGDRLGHAWLTPSGRILESGPEGVVDHMQHERFTTPTSWVVSLDPSQEREYWFGNGTQAYVLTRQGLGGPMDVCPTALCRAAGALVGAGAGLDNEDTLSIEFYAHEHDLGYRGSKRIQVVEVAQDGLSGLQVDVIAGGVSMGAVQTNSLGVGYPVRSGNEVSIGIKGAANVGSSYSIQRATVRFQSEGRQHKRGTGAPPEDS